MYFYILYYIYQVPGTYEGSFSIVYMLQFTLSQLPIQIIFMHMHIICIYIYKYIYIETISLKNVLPPTSPSIYYIYIIHSVFLPHV